MNKKKRIIFDIDNTLIVPNYYMEKEFIDDVLPGNGISDVMSDILLKYECLHSRYDRKSLVQYLNCYSKVLITDEFIDKWFDFNIRLKKQDVSDTVCILEYLCDKGYELVALSNFFTYVQSEKLKFVGIRDYFIDVFGGDYFLKPNFDSFRNAIGERSASECLMVGDSLDVDVIGSLKFGMDAFHFTNGKEVNHEYPKIKKLIDLKNIL